MEKYAAEKIASDYYNLGVQLALYGHSFTKTAAPIGRRIASMLTRAPAAPKGRRIAATLAGASVAPGVLEEVGRLVGSRALAGETGRMQSQALRKLLGLESDFISRIGAGDLLGSIPTAIKHDASRLLSGKGLNYDSGIYSF